MILSVSTKPGFELKVNVATFVVNEPVVIVGTTERTKEIVFVPSPVNKATGSLKRAIILAAIPAWVSPGNGVTEVGVGAEVSVEIVINEPNGMLKLSTASTA